WFRIASVISDIADPDGRSVRELALETDVPGLRARVSPIAPVPNRRRLRAGGDHDGTRGVDRGLADEVASRRPGYERVVKGRILREDIVRESQIQRDRKSTRLNSSHVSISYAVFCL